MSESESNREVECGATIEVRVSIDEHGGVYLIPVVGNGEWALEDGDKLIVRCDNTWYIDHDESGHTQVNEEAGTVRWGCRYCDTEHLHFINKDLSALPVAPVMAVNSSELEGDGHMPFVHAQVGKVQINCYQAMDSEDRPLPYVVVDVDTTMDASPYGEAVTVTVDDQTVFSNRGM